MADAIKNFAYSTVLTAPSPADTGTSLTVQSGEGALFPTPPFNVTVWPAGTIPLSSNAEIVRVTAIVGDVFTISRQAEGSSSRSIIVGDSISATITAKGMGDRVDVAGDELTGDLVGTDFVRTRDGTISYDGNGYIDEIALTGGRRLTYVRDGSNFITSASDDFRTWVYTRDGSNRITSWVVEDSPKNYTKANLE